MSSVQAVTQNLVFSVRVASFYPLSDSANKAILKEVSEVMERLGKEHNFLVWRTCIELNQKDFNDRGDT